MGRSHCKQIQGPRRVLEAQNAVCYSFLMAWQSHTDVSNVTSWAKKEWWVRWGLVISLYLYLNYHFVFITQLTIRKNTYSIFKHNTCSIVLIPAWKKVSLYWPILIDSSHSSTDLKGAPSLPLVLGNRMETLGGNEQAINIWKRFNWKPMQLTILKVQQF